MDGHLYMLWVGGVAPGRALGFKNRFWFRGPGNFDDDPTTRWARGEGKKVRGKERR